MLTYYREKKFPVCFTCGKQMEYWVPGLSDDLHEHAKCAGKRIAEEILQVSFAKIIEVTLNDESHKV